MALLSALLLGGCETEKIDDTAVTPPRKLELIGLLRAGDFAALDKRIGVLQRAFEAGRISDEPVNAAFEAFAAADPALEAKLSDWIAGNSKSYAALAARGVYRFHIGAIHRGTASAAKTGPDRFATMAESFEKANADFYAALAINPRVAYPYSRLMSIEAMSGSHDELDRIYDIARHNIPTAREPHIVRARSLYPNWGGSEVELLAFLTLAKAKSVLDGSYDALAGEWDFYQARKMCWLQRYEEGLEIYRAIVAQHDTAEVRLAMLCPLSKLERRDEELKALERAVELDPENVKALGNLGYEYMRRENDAAALEHFNLALALDPFNPEWLADRATVLQKLGRAADAERDLQNAAVYGTHDTYVAKRQAAFLLGVKKDYAGAKALYAKLIEAEPKNPDFRIRYARTLLFLEDCDYIDAVSTYIRMCRADGECDKLSARAKVYEADQFKMAHRCGGPAAVPELRADLLRNVPLTTMKIHDIGPTATMTDIRARYPGAEVRPAKKRKPDDPDRVQVQYTDPGNTFYFVATLDDGDRLLDVTLIEIRPEGGDIAAIRDGLVAAYGDPEIAQPADTGRARIDYRETDDQGKGVASLSIAIAEAATGGTTDAKAADPAAPAKPTPIQIVYRLTNERNLRAEK